MVGMVLSYQQRQAAGGYEVVNIKHAAQSACQHQPGHRGIAPQLRGPPSRNIPLNAGHQRVGSVVHQRQAPAAGPSAMRRKPYLGSTRRGATRSPTRSTKTRAPYGASDALSAITIEARTNWGCETLKPKLKPVQDPGRMSRKSENMSAFWLLCLISGALARVLIIDDFGAIPNSKSASASNAIAISAALSHAQAGDIVRVPAGNEYWSFGGILGKGLQGVVIEIIGTLIATPDMKAWPKTPPGSNDCADFLVLDRCVNITLRGSGLVDGQGLTWWNHVIAGFKPDYSRPYLIRVISCLFAHWCKKMLII
jgi:hypothetical protein